MNRDDVADLIHPIARPWPLRDRHEWKDDPGDQHRVYTADGPGTLVCDSQLVSLAETG